MSDNWFIDNLWWMLICGFVGVIFVVIIFGGSFGTFFKKFREIAKNLLCFIPKTLTDMIDSCRDSQRRRRRIKKEKKEKKKKENQKKKEMDEKKKKAQKTIKENKEVTNELAKKSVSKWENKHFISLLKQLGFPSKYHSKLSLYSGDMLISDEFFCDSFESMNNTTTIFDNKQDLVERFLSIMRLLRFYPTKHIPKEFLSLTCVEEFLNKNGLDANIPKVREKQLHFAYIMEMTPQELNMAFDENNVHFGKILSSHLRKYRNKEVNNKYDNYINTIVTNLTEKSFKTVAFVMNGQLDKLNTGSNLIDPMNLPPIQGQSFNPELNQPPINQPPISDFQNYPPLNNFNNQPLMNVQNTNVDNKNDGNEPIVYGF